MTMRIMMLAGSALIALAACGQGGDSATTAAPATPAAATPSPAAPTIAPAATASAPASPAAPSAADAERAKLDALLKVLPDQAAWTKACTDDQLDAKICDCAGKAVVKTLGTKGLYAWVWQGYIKRDGTAQMRS